MQFLNDLWLPIIVSGVGVFIMSALVWTASPHHKTEFAPVVNEGAVMDALRAGGITPGRYMTPFMGDRERAQSPEGKRCSSVDRSRSSRCDRPACPTWAR